MKSKEYRGIVKKLGGTIGRYSHIVDFPDTLRITTKGEALDLLDVLINAQDESNGNFTVNLNTPFEKLRDAIGRGIAGKE